MSRAVVIQHAHTGAPAILGDWLAARGIPFDLHDTALGAPIPALEDDVPFVASLGAAQSANDDHLPAVRDEAALLGEAVRRDVPVLGLCFGGQLLARTLGGDVERMSAPEVGWIELDTDDPEVVPAGPWLAWHYDRFSVPPGAREVARTDRAPHAFVAGPHLGTQFHPEATQDQVRVWAAKDAERLATFGVTDGLERLQADAGRQRAARDAAFALFDAFLARIPHPVPSS